MRRISLPLVAVLAACTPSPRKAAMPSPSPVSGDTAKSPRETSAESQGSAMPAAVDAIGVAGGNREQAAQRPIPAVSAAGNPAPMPRADTPAEALGRRTLSTAFVRVGPDGHLTVELHGGRVLVLRDVVMRARDYCGKQVSGAPARARYCGNYAEVAAARPGGAPDPAVAAPAGR